jgi:hypothetical protein|tara:strand:- start:13 stop:234 length:222 start_codon:yes stop_codon:yes gene_type:complete
MKKKSTPKKPRSALTPEDRAEIVGVLNKSRSVAHNVLECGSALAIDLHELDDQATRLGRRLGFKQENWYSDFE